MQFFKRIVVLKKKKYEKDIILEFLTLDGGLHGADGVRK